MSHQSHTYGPGSWKVIFPDGKEYELKEVHMTWTTEFKDIPQDGNPQSAIVHRKPLGTTIQFKE